MSRFCKTDAEATDREQEGHMACVIVFIRIRDLRKPGGISAVIYFANRSRLAPL